MSRLKLKVTFFITFFAFIASGATREINEFITQNPGGDLSQEVEFTTNEIEVTEETTKIVLIDDDGTTTQPPEVVKIQPDFGKVCGQQKVATIQPAYVIGGKPASVGEFPWFAAITKYQHNKNPRWKVVCGATLINSYYAITAAHCLHNRFKDTLEVVFNIKDAHNIDNDKATVRRKIQRFVIHPKYNTSTLHNDIALIQFKSPIKFQSEKPVPICLPASSQTKFASQPGSFAGFGHTGYGTGSTEDQRDNSRILLKVNVPILSHKQCLDSKVPSKKQITDAMICAGSQGKDACINDSGGPLMVQQNGQTVLVGVASWGIGCALEGYPGVYTRVSEYLDWIRQASSS